MTEFFFFFFCEQLSDNGFGSSKNPDRGNKRDINEKNISNFIVKLVKSNLSDNISDAQGKHIDEEMK